MDAPATQLATFSFEREGPRRTCARAPEGAGRAAIAAPTAGFGVGLVLCLLCAYGRHSVMGVALRASMPGILAITAIAAVACGVCVALLRAHARGVPFVVGPVLAMALAPLLAGAASARIDWARSMRALQNPYDALAGPERGMFLFGLGAVASATLAVGIAVALRRIAAALSDRDGARAPSWLALTLVALSLGCIAEAFARWVLPGPAALPAATDHSLRDWDALLSALPLVRAVGCGLAAMLVGLALVAAARARSASALGATGLAVALLAGTSAMARAAVEGAEQIVSRAPAFQVALVPDFVATPVAAYVGSDAIDLMVAPDFVVGRDARRFPRSDLTRLARERMSERHTDVAILPSQGDASRARLFGFRLTYLPESAQLDLAIDSRLTQEQLAALVRELASAGVGRVTITGPDPLASPSDTLRSPLLRIGTRRFAATQVSLEGWDLKARSMNGVHATSTHVDGTTVELRATSGPERTWQVQRARVLALHQASAAEDAAANYEEILRTGGPLTPAVVWVPVTLGTITDVLRAVSILDVAGLASVLCVDRCP